jgi:hypothetical protein
MMKGVHFLAIVALLSLTSSLVCAEDPSPLQDICVAIDEPKSAGIYLFIKLLHIYIIMVPMLSIEVHYLLLRSKTIYIAFLLLYAIFFFFL